LIVTGFTLVGMLYFGVRLKGYRPDKNVRWSASGAGLDFQMDAQAVTEGFFPAAKGASGADLSIELAILPVFQKYGNLVIHRAEVASM